MEFLVVLVGFAIGCGFLAKNKGRSVGGWATAGFFLGVFALIALALMKPKRSGVVPSPLPGFPNSYGAPGTPPPGQYGAPRE